MTNKQSDKLILILKKLRKFILLWSKYNLNFYLFNLNLNLKKLAKILYKLPILNYLVCHDLDIVCHYYSIDWVCLGVATDILL